MCAYMIVGTHCTAKAINPSVQSPYTTSISSSRPKIHVPIQTHRPEEVETLRKLLPKAPTFTRAPDAEEAPALKVGR